MSLKKYVKGVNNRKQLIDELLDIIINDSELKSNKLKQLKVDSINDVFDEFISIGNMAYSNGDVTIYKYFMDSLFYLIDNEPKNTLKRDIFNNIEHFMNMCIEHNNKLSYAIILKNFQNQIFKTKDSFIAYDYVKFLEIFINNALKRNFTGGVMITLQAFININHHFNDYSMHLNSANLKNFLVVLCSTKIQSVSLDEDEKKFIMLLSQEVMKNTENYELNPFNMRTSDHQEGILEVI
jgi:hypothetical protein